MSYPDQVEGLVNMYTALELEVMCHNDKGQTQEIDTNDIVTCNSEDEDKIFKKIF